MKLQLALALLLFTLPASAQAKTPWALVKSTLTYHMTHPLHDVNGVSHTARGKGICEKGECNILIAVPVKSFNSGDSNRDLHMIEATRGAEYPMVVVRAKFPEAATQSSTIYADLQVQFAGQTASYTHVPFQRTRQGKDIRITGTIPSTCSDFKIVRPSFLTVPISNQIPVSVDTTWQPM
ncbi:MAG TPA: hypothetical protein VMU92_05860 [Acidobacteriaceae bacterium]|nr:hypothetical protein [Acidobacteriaceae bacterium]